MFVILVACLCVCICVCVFVCVCVSDVLRGQSDVISE